MLANRSSLRFLIFLMYFYGLIVQIRIKMKLTKDNIEHAFGVKTDLFDQPRIYLPPDERVLIKDALIKRIDQIQSINIEKVAKAFLIDKNELVNIIEEICDEHYLDKSFLSLAYVNDSRKDKKNAIKKILDQHANINKSHLAEKFGVSRATIYRYAEQVEKEREERMSKERQELIKKGIINE